MNETLKRLHEWGCDVPDAMRRMLGDEEFYLHCLREFTVDPAFKRLEKAITSSDYAEAFESAHMLKGASATLGLTPLYEDICTVVEDVRYDPRPAIREDYKNMRRTYREFQELMHS